MHRALWWNRRHFVHTRKQHWPSPKLTHTFRFESVADDAIDMARIECGLHNNHESESAVNAHAPPHNNFHETLSVHRNWWKFLLCERTEDRTASKMNIEYSVFCDRISSKIFSQWRQCGVWIACSSIIRHHSMPLSLKRKSCLFNQLQLHACVPWKLRCPQSSISITCNVFVSIGIRVESWINQSPINFP